MPRKIFAVVLGYLTMLVLVMLWLTGAFMVMGTDRVFHPGNYEVTNAWLVVWACVSITAALFGGIVCAKVGRTRGPVIALVIIVAVLGSANLAWRLASDGPPPEDLIRSGDVSNTEAMMNAQAPVWVYASETLMGILGVIAGASLVCRKGCNAPKSET